MNPTIEILLVALIVGAAFLAIARRCYRFFFTGDKNCGSACGGCSSNTIGHDSLKPLVDLTLPKREEGSR